MDPDASLTTATLHAWRRDLAGLTSVDDADRVDQLRALENLKCAAAAAQARVTAQLAASVRAQQEAAGVPARDLGKGVAAQVGLARRDSPFRGGRHVGLAHALGEMPHAAAAFTRGEVSEWRVTVLARETACLTRADREEVDRRLAARTGGYAAMGDRAVEHESRRLAYALDPHSFTRRSAQAVNDRRVSLRPAPDTMSVLSALLPVTQGVAVFAALTRHANTLRAAGDPRGRGQIMADTLVERVTGQASASAVPIEVNVVISDTALLATDPTPAHVEGFGPVPASVARGWLVPRTSRTDGPSDAAPVGAAGDDAAGAAVWVRRLYARPADGTLVAMDTTRRLFTGQLRRFIRVRDQRCRTPWCDAPIRHVDHPTRHTDGGLTSAINSQGLCEACNHAKEAIGWHARASGGTTAGDGEVVTTTPTGHRYSSPVPRSPVAAEVPSVPDSRSRIEVSFRDLILMA